MTVRRILYARPAGAPAKIDEHGLEGHVPYSCKWSDGSEYIAVDDGVRRFHGPMFGRPLGDWKLEPIGGEAP